MKDLVLIIIIITILASVLKNNINYYNDLDYYVCIEAFQSATKSISAGAWSEFVIEFVKEGYEALGIVSFILSDWYDCLSLSMYYYGSDNNFHIVYRNDSTQNISLYIGIRVLCRKII